MARLAFTALPAWEDLAPTLPVAHRLTENGHHVRYVVGGQVAARVRAEGFEVQIVDPTRGLSPSEVEASLPDPHPPADRWIAIVQTAVLPQAAETFALLARWSDDVDAILTTTWQLAGPLVTEVNRRPVVRIATTGQDLSLPAGTGPASDGDPMRELDEPLNRLRRHLGLPLGENLLGRAQAADLTLLLTSELLEPETATTGAVTTGLCRPVAGAVLAPDLAGFLAEPGVVCLCTFSLPPDRRNAMIQMAAQALQATEHRGILVTDPGATTAEVHIVSPRLAMSTGVEATTLARYCSAIVHTPDFDSCRAALTASLPSLALTATVEQSLWAARLTRLGNGVTLPAATATPARIAERLQELLGQPRYGVRAAQVAALVAIEDGAGRACEEIERLLGGL